MLLVIMLLGIMLSNNAGAMGMNYGHYDNVGDLCRSFFNHSVDYGDGQCIVTTNARKKLSKLTLRVNKKTITGDQLASRLEAMATKRLGSMATAENKSHYYKNLKNKVRALVGNTSFSDKADIINGLYITLAALETDSRIRGAEERAKQPSVFEIASMKRYGTKVKPETTFIRFNDEVIEINNSLLNTEAVQETLSDAEYRPVTDEEKNSTDVRYADTEDKLENGVMTYERQGYGKGFFSNNKFLRTSAFYTPEMLKWLDDDYAEKGDTMLLGSRSMMLDDMTIQGIKNYISNFNSDIKSGRLSGMKKEISKADINTIISFIIDGRLADLTMDEGYETTMFQGQYLGLYEGTNNLMAKSVIKDLGYFGYIIDLEPTSPDYLKIKYDASKNQAIGQIDYVK